ncbi:MAG TPA: hypothetical protein VM680_10180 [Verrucomicrobiae bacterium]|nr:hypothetical protein [Verrucomicrobiae bacterium]
MDEVAPQDELLRALGKLVRGLSALFWGLPITLLVCVRTAMSDRLQRLEMFPPIFAMCLLYYGVLLLGDFQKQERIWRTALDRAKLVGVVNIGLAPFIYWWNQIPSVTFYSLAVGTLMLSGLIFLFNLNHLLQRLAAMLPDETLRMETRLFGAMNLNLLCGILALVALYAILQQINTLPNWVIDFLKLLDISRNWLLIFMILLPIAMTMTLIWKTKEVIFASVFTHRH